MMKWLILLICIFTSCNTQVLPPSSISILGLTKMIIKSSWDLVEDRSIIEMPGHQEHKLQTIVQRISAMDTSLTHLSQVVASVRLETMSKVTKYLINITGVYTKFDDLIKHIDEVNSAYTRMLTYAKDETVVSRTTLKDFAMHSVLSRQRFSVKMSMEAIHKFVAPKEKSINRQTSLLELLSTSKDSDNKSICISIQSQNQLLYNLYNVVSLTYIKAYALLQFSYTLLEIDGVETFAWESKVAKTDFVSKTIVFAERIQTALNETSLHFWRCDPPKYRKGKNYLEITQLLQGYIQNEISLNKGGTCTADCSHYVQTKSYNCMRDTDYCRKQRECHGEILDCKPLESRMSVCSDYSLSGRRYKYIKYDNGKTLGLKNVSCSKLNEIATWNRWIFWECSYCMCLCNEDSLFSERYFSLRSSVSNVIENKVVTGVRFVKKNKIIHLQVQQGEILPHGVINESTLEWVPVNNFRKTDRNTRNHYDYFKLNYTERAINLDILNAQEGRVLTGIRFSTLGSHLNLEIRTTSFNFETGKLISPKISSGWDFNKNTEFSGRTKINLEEPDIPTTFSSPSKIVSSHNQFVQFTNTDLYKDAAQTTVPFIDSQDVVPAVPIPITGAGVYFKTTEGSGGFIGLKLITYNFSKHLYYN